MPSPTRNPGDQPRRPQDTEESSGVRPGLHPSAERTSGGRGVAITLVVLLALVALALLAMTIAGTLTG